MEAYRNAATVDAFWTPRSGSAYQPIIPTGGVRHEEDDPALLYNGVPLTMTATSWSVTNWSLGRASKGYAAQSRTASDTVV